MSALNVVLPLGSSVLSFIFGVMVLDQWWQRRHSFQLVWGIGLLWYGLSAGTEFMGSAFGWNEPLYRMWYLTGAFFVAAYLGAGTIYLLSKSRFCYFAGATILVGGLLSFLFSRSSLYPGSSGAGTAAFAIALVGGVAVIIATATRRALAAHIAMGVLAVGSLAVAYMVLGAHLAAGVGTRSCAGVGRCGMPRRAWPALPGAAEQADRPPHSARSMDRFPLPAASAGSDGWPF